MQCNKCGNEIQEGTSFCSKCGAKVEQVTQQPTSDKQSSGKVPAGMIVAVAAGIVVVIVIIIAVLVVGKKTPTGNVTDGEQLVEESNVTDALETEGLTNPAEQTPLYSITDVATIDIYAQNYMPGAKQEGITWDSTLFYWLEDVDQSSSEDGYLSKCQISKTLLRNAEDGQLVQYEIYRDPNTAEIYKIVSIEAAEDGLKLTDYYYSGGKPNFIFVRNDSVYTPTYATTDKTGERFYFHQDVLARWRMIRVPGEIGEYVLTSTENVWYSQANYFTETAEVQQAYNNIEMRMLNAAYNTFNAVSAQSVGIIEGKVQDTTGAGLGSLTVDVLRKSDNALLYRGTTADDGTFRILTYLDNSECYILIRGNETYKEAAVYGIFLADSGITNAYSNLLLHKVGGDEYPVHINVYSAADVRTGEDGSLVKNLLAGSKVSVRAGVGAYTGDVLLTAEADAEGRVHANLQSGNYTLQIETPGYSISYLEVEVTEQETTVDGYVLPALQEDKTGIVLTWEGADVDLDLTLFTPYQSTGGDMAHIGSTIPDDGHGNQLLADNGTGCEVMYVNTAELGNYKLYVNNYTDSQAGNYDSNVLGTLNVHIYIYDINGFVAEYSFPVGQTGVVWEVVDISGKQITPSNRVYNQIEGKSWWMESKEELNIKECDALQLLLESMTDIAYGRYEYDGYVPDITGELAAQDWNLIDSIIGTGIRWYGYDRCAYIGGIQSLPEVESLRYMGSGLYFKIPQIEHVAYSITGQKWVLNNIGQMDVSWHDVQGEYIGFGEGDAGMACGIELENYRSEYVGGNEWKVMADCLYWADWAPTYQVATVTATVFRNPNSCFDGFSISDFSVDIINNDGWMNAYYEYLVNNPFYASEIDGQQNNFLNKTYFCHSYYLNYIDADSIPEIYIRGTTYAEGDMLLYYHEGEVCEVYLASGVASYIPYSGLALNSSGKQGVYPDIVYQLIDGEMKVIAEGWKDYGIEGDALQRAEWNGQEVVTEEEYDTLLKECYDVTQSKECGPYEYDTCYLWDIDSALSFFEQGYFY